MEWNLDEIKTIKTVGLHRMSPAQQQMTTCQMARLETRENSWKYLRYNYSGMLCQNVKLLTLPSFNGVVWPVEYLQIERSILLPFKQSGSVHIIDIR